MQELNESLNELIARAQAGIAASDDLAALDSVRVSFLGKKGELTEQLKGLGKLSSEARPAAGQAINAAKQKVQLALDERRQSLEDAALAADLKASAVDVSLRGRGDTLGGRHPVTRTRARIEAIFRGAGFDVATALRLRMISTISPRSMCLPTIRLERCTIPSILAMTAYCGPIPRRYRFVRCRRMVCLSG